MQTVKQQAQLFLKQLRHLPANPLRPLIFCLLLHYQPSPCAQVSLVHTVPAFEVINGYIIGTGDLPKRVVGLHGVGFAALARGCFVLLSAQAAIRPGNHGAARCR